MQCVELYLELLDMYYQENITLKEFLLKKCFLGITCIVIYATVSNLQSQNSPFSKELTYFYINTLPADKNLFASLKDAYEIE